MSRRRLRLADSSDEEDEPRHQLQQSTPDNDASMQGVAAGGVAQTPASTTLNPNPNDDFPSPPLEISDDDEVFIEASDNLSPPSPEDSVPAEAFRPPPTSDDLTTRFREYLVPGEAVQTPPFDGAEVETGRLIREFLYGLGLRLRSDWVTSCLRELESSVPGFGSFGVDRRAELCFGQFLMSDINYSGAGVLPHNVGSMHLVDLAGPFVLQVDEMVNISCPLRQKYHKAAPGNKRCLKLSMTDGIHRIFGMEYRPIKDLDVLAPAGLKVAIRNVHVRHGLLMLVPEVIDVLGGMVEELEAAHLRLVTEIDKPPRGKRPRMGDIPPIATRATHAAWPSTFVNGREPILNSGPQNSESMQTPVGVSAQGHPFSHWSNKPGTSSTTGAGGSTTSQILHFDAQATRREQHHQSGVFDVPPVPVSAAPRTCPSVGASDSGPDLTLHSRLQHLNSLQTSAGNGRGFHQAPHPGTRSSDAKMTNAGINRDGRAAGYFSNDANRETTDFNRSLNTFIVVEDIDMTDDTVETMVNSMITAETDQFSNPCGNIDGMNAIDEVKHALMLSGDQEIPFTYLASLSAKLSASEDSIASVKGKIKCFMTGVKGFQYKERSTYELRAYVDDGSLISEILIDHSVVLNKIGYSPMEVSAAISSSDSIVASHMKEIIKKFQSFLINFEGTMTLQLKRSSPTPVAIEMNQGCPTSDAWLLLKRVKTFSRVQTPQTLEPIVLSP